MKRLLPLLLFLTAWLLPSLALARTISWSNMVEDNFFNSQGVALDATFTFEIGIFINGFVPSATNLNDWNANWLVFDAAIANDGWNVNAQFFSSSTEQLSSGESSSGFASPGIFPANAQAYLWVYNSKAVADSSERALVSDLSPTGNIEGTDRWIFPAPPVAQSTSPILTWQLADAETAIYGAVQSGGSQGGGSVSNQPGVFSLQTYQVPEPGSTLLIGAAGVLILMRRRRFFRYPGRQGRHLKIFWPQ